MSKSYHACCQPLLRLAGRCTPTSPRCRFQLSRFRFTTRRTLDLIANSARFDRCRCAVSLFGCVLSSVASSQPSTAGPGFKSLQAMVQAQVRVPIGFFSPQQGVGVYRNSHIFRCTHFFRHPLSIFRIKAIIFRRRCGRNPRCEKKRF